MFLSLRTCAVKSRLLGSQGKNHICQSFFGGRGSTISMVSEIQEVVSVRLV